jgi:two-component system sensor histidine kinase BaeS
VTNPAVSPEAVAERQRPLLDSLFGAVWPERSLAARPRLVAAAAAVGVLAAMVTPSRDWGIGTFLVLATVCGVVAVADERLRTPYHLASAALALLLMSPLFLLDADWIVVLCLAAAFAVGAAALAEGRSVTGLAASMAAIPLASLRGLPWLGRSLTVVRGSRTWAPLLRTAVLSLLAVVVFGALFASADAVFARWADAVVPDLSFGSLGERLFVWLAVGGLTLAGVYVALNPPRVERLALPAGTPVGRRFEWLVPASLVVVVFAVFVVAQLTVMFGGHGYVRRTTGLTYADYVHEGFAQLTLATVLTLGVIALAVRKAPRAEARDRALLRAVLGALCLLTLLVVASALYRMHVYEEAYGFTRLRLLVSFFEGWLGLVVLLVMLAGIRLQGSWIPRATLLTGASTLLALAALNPDAYIAERNVERYERTQRVDWYYLSGLSADATPALVDLPARLRGCVVPPRTGSDDWLEWNLGRARARGALAAGQPDGSQGCEGTSPIG